MKLHSCTYCGVVLDHEVLTYDIVTTADGYDEPRHVEYEDGRTFPMIPCPVCKILIRYEG